MYRIEVYDVTDGLWVLVDVQRVGSALAAAKTCEFARRRGCAATCRPAIPLDARRAAYEETH